jgi:GT2 family glycosyltransferase
MATNNKIKPPVRLSIIIVSYNTEKLLDNCLKSIYNSDFPAGDFEVIVVDNASNDGSPEMIKKRHPGVRLIENSINSGFAKANNAGIRIARGENILLLNSDTEVSPDVFLKMREFMTEHPHTGASTCRLVLSNGKLDPACHRGFPTPLNSLAYFSGLDRIFPGSKLFGGYHLTYLNLSKPHEIDCPSGAFFWTTKSVIDRVGLLDEDFFMYAEDIDWAYRIKKAGYQIWFNPEVTVTHFKKQSGRNHTDRVRKINTEIMFHESNRLFYRKHLQQTNPGVVNFLVEAIYNIRINLLKKIGI